MASASWRSENAAEDMDTQKPPGPLHLLDTHPARGYWHMDWFWEELPCVSTRAAPLHIPPTACRKLPIPPHYWQHSFLSFLLLLLFAWGSLSLSLPHFSLSLSLSVVWVGLYVFNNSHSSSINRHRLVVLIFMSLMGVNSDTEHFFTYQLAIWMSSLGNCLCLFPNQDFWVWVFGLCVLLSWTSPPSLIDKLLPNLHSCSTGSTDATLH